MYIPPVTLYSIHICTLGDPGNYQPICDLNGVVRKFTREEVEAMRIGIQLREEEIKV